MRVPGEKRRCKIPELSNLEGTLSQYPKVKVLSLDIGTDVPEKHSHNYAVSLEQLPHIIGVKCALVEKLRIVYRRNCSLWRFAEHLDGIFCLPRLVSYEFVWRGESPGIMGFMGNYDTDVQQGTLAVLTLLSWSEVFEDSCCSTQVTLEGVNCVCRDPQKECPNPEACRMLKQFLEMCNYHEIPLKKI